MIVLTVFIENILELDISAVTFHKVFVYGCNVNLDIVANLKNYVAVIQGKVIFSAKEILKNT